jgi:photosystem II stability/assembly factor-like uncharacterized protein
MAAGALVGAGAPAAAQEVDGAYFQDLQWRHVGPFRGGRSVAATGVPSDPLTYYMGGVGSGVWKTTDAGNTWVNISGLEFGTSSVGAIAVADSDPNVVYVGMGEHAPRGVMTSHGDGVYKSTDAGKTWTHVGLDRTRHIARIRIHPDDPDLVYVAAQGAAYGETEDRGVYRSRDGGETWEKVLYNGVRGSASELAMDPTNPRILYAAFWDHLRVPWQVQSGGDASGLWKSTDGGDTWSEINNGLPDLMGKTAVDVSPANPERLFAMIEADPGGGLYRSDDAGASWRLMTEDWTLRARPWYYTEVFADPQDENTVYVLSAPMVRSIDGGRTFQRVPTPHGDNHDLWINPNDSDVMINANDGGANVSFNGGETWSTQQNQPTVQFYRVNVDNRFPYHIYGGQQDNSAIAIASAARGGIGWEDFYSISGCESAIPAFDRQDPRWVFGGCYMGIMSVFDHRSGASRNAQAYPVMPAALRADEMKYRFNWSSPLLVSQHNPDVLYHGANVVLRSLDLGKSWEEVSPDLTRDQEDKQGYGGAPITNEGAGGEIYGTITWIAESPLQEGLLWVTSDDGLVHLSRDGATSWTNVTPDGLAEGLVNAVDASPHDPGTAYIAFNRYKENDFTPRAFRTDDFGESWTEIGEGFEFEHFVRVVREDPVRPGLLYAGTEGGVYVSFNNGDLWQPLQLNLPRTPITDIIVQPEMNDLVIATSGYGFWILDDLSSLQQVDAAQGAAQNGRPHLYAPRAAYRVAGGGWGGGFGGGGSQGRNPPNGATLDFYLQDEPSGEVRLEILDGDGGLVRAYSTNPSEGLLEEELSAGAGMNRVVWNLRHTDVYRVPGLYVFGGLQGRRVVPGDYTVRLSVAPGSADEGSTAEGGGESMVEPAVLTQTVTVLKDPRVETTQAEFEEQDAFLVQLLTETEALHRSVVELGQVRAQVETILERVAEMEESEAEGEAVQRVQTLGDALVDSLTAVEDSLVQFQTYDGQTVLNAPSRINFQYIYLMGNMEGSDDGITQGGRDVFQDMNARWRPQQQKLERILDEQVDDFNEAVEDAGIPPVDRPRRPRAVT